MQAFDLKHLTIITTAACNLNCKYCTIAKNKTDTSSLLHKNTAQALKDGTYLENVKKVYQKLGLATAQVETLDFWGQEPTLTLDYITMNLSNWLRAFPNLKSILFSTNGVAHTNKIIDFIKELDKITNHKITLDIQISWDGKLSTEEIRQADSDIILKNTQYLIDEINKIKLNHVHINLQMHGVLSRSLIDELDTVEKVQKYFIDSNAEVNKIVDSCYNKNVHFAPLLGLGFENPVPASTQDGLDFHRFFRAGLTTNPDEFAKDQRDSVLIQPLIDLTRLMDAYLLKKDYFENILDILDSTTDLGRIERELNCLSQQLLCGAFAVELKIMYDGTIISCQNHMFGLKADDIKEDNSVENQVKKYLANKNYYMNPLAEDFKMEDFENWREAFIIGKTNSFLYTFQQTVALMYYLSLARQIRPDYASNFRKLILHAFIITPVRQCPYNVYVTTGSLYNKDTGLLRWYCNGILDEVEDYMNLQREKGAQPDGIR